MEAINQIVNFAASAVEAAGIAVAAYGAYSFFEGASQQTAIKKLEGLLYIVGGVGIYLLGLKIIPLILTVFNV